jgi:PST family polysaccharide transporter
LKPLKPFDSSGAFRPGTNQLLGLALRGAGVTVLTSGLGLGIQVISTITLARLLTPRDFGVVTMVTTFSLLLLNFGLNGFTEAVIQTAEINDALVSNLFWINLGFGALLTVAFAATGSLMAKFYREPQVASVAIGISLTIFLTSTSVQHLALLKRSMRFSVVSANDICARIIAIGLMIVLAWAKWGYWALVAGTVVQPVAQSLGAWYLCRWVPSLPRKAPGTGSMVRFAINVYGRFSVNYFARNMDNLLVGWRFDAPTLGYYKKAYDLFALSASQLVSPLTVVAVSALSRLDRHSAEFKRYLLRALSVTAFVGMGVGACLTLVGGDVIRVVLGPGWEESGRIFTFFGAGIGVMLLYGTHGWIHLSIGRADRWFRWGIAEFAFTGLLFLLGLHWGPVGIATAWTASFWILTIPAFWYAGNPINLGVGIIIEAVWRYLLASSLAGAAAAFILRGFPSLHAAPGTLGAALRIGVTSLLFTVLYLGSVTLLYWGCTPLYQLAGLVREMVPWGKLSRRFARAGEAGAHTEGQPAVTPEKANELVS